MAFGVHCSGNMVGIVFSKCIYRQVTGCIMECMSDKEDVEDYVHDELKQQVVKFVDMLRLLKYIEGFDRPEKQRQSVAMVHMHHACATIFHPKFTLVLSCPHNIFLSYAPLLHARHNIESGDANRTGERSAGIICGRSGTPAIAPRVDLFCERLKTGKCASAVCVASRFYKRHIHLLHLVGQWR